ncbi:MAG: lactate utilization protein [Bacillota bacterium]
MDKEKINKLMSALEKNKISAVFVETADDAKAYVLKSIPQNTSVGIGGSMTVYNMNLHHEISDKGNPVHWHWLETTPEKRAEAIEKANRADVYLTSTNAITMQGEIVNIDGNGNRVTAMIHGPKKVMILCGINKITDNLITAVDRVKNQACPPNAKRLNRKTPCAVTGDCSDCRSEDRMCSVTTIIHQKPGLIDMEVVLIGENLGY